MRPVMKSKVLRILRQIAIWYLVLCALLGLLQRTLIYFPSRAAESTLLAEARSLRCEPWRDASGSIIGWKSARAQRPVPANRLVVFHGNAGYALHRTHFFAGFEALDGGRTWEVFIFEYPGYGARKGELGEESFIHAGVQALEALAAADSRPIYLLGESLGSGLGGALAGRLPQRVAGIFFLTPFASLKGVAAHHYPFIPVGLILRDKWDNVAALRGYSGPVAVLLASDDEVVTAAQSRLLFDQYAGPKRLWIEDGARHNTIDFSPAAPWWREISDFLLSTPPAHLSPP